MKALRLVLLGLALAIIGGLGWRLSHPMLVPDAPPAPVTAAVDRPEASAHATVLSRLKDAPDYQPFFDRLQSDFPSTYANLIDRATAAAVKTGRPPNPERMLTDALRNLRQTRGVLAAQAEPQPLAELFAAQSAVLDALASADAGLCTDFLYGGTSPAFMAFAAEHRPLLARIAMASLDAIANGQARHVDHDQPTSGDFDQLTAALKARNISDDEIAAVLDGKTFDPPLPEKELCEAGRTYLHVLNDMPVDMKLRIYALSAQLLARS